MNSSQTKWLVGLALALLTFIVVFELRQQGGPPPSPATGQLVPGLRAATVTRVEFTRSNQTFRADYVANQWRLTAPLAYPANALLLRTFLDVCARLRPQLLIPTAQSKSPAEFGLQPPQATFIFHQGGSRIELRIGSRTPVNNQLYVQVAGADQVAVTDANLLEFLPRTPDDWRDRSLISLTGVKFDRLRVRTGTRDLLLERETTNQLWRITLPTPPKRANTPRIERLVADLQQWPVKEFVSDDPRADLETFGLLTPESELAFAQGTNDALVVQFGRSPTNQPEFVYARSLATTNIMLVPHDLLDQLRADYWNFSEHRLLDALPADAVNTLTVQGRETFSLRQMTNAATNLVWIADDPAKTTMDPELMQGFLASLVTLEAVELAKEVVTDFAPYGLATPARSISLSRSFTNAGGLLTNVLVARLDFGTGPVDRVFARRQDENSVYVVPRGDVDRLAWSLHEIQDRTVWNFTSNQVTAVTVEFDGRTRRLTRSANGRWLEGAEAADDLRNLAMEETMFRLGRLRAERWTYLGVDRLPIYGVSDQSHRVAIELAGTPAKTNSIIFGISPARRNPYAAITDPRSGQPLVFEFPRLLYLDYVMPYLGR